MSSEDLIKLERHQMLRDAHATMAQSIKYPGTVNPVHVAKAAEIIKSHSILREFASRQQQGGANG